MRTICMQWIRQFPVIEDTQMPAQSDNYGEVTWLIGLGEVLILIQRKLEAASTHWSAKTHAGNVFTTRDLDLRPFDPKINDFPGLIVEHLCVMFRDPSWIGCWYIVQKNCETDTQTNSGENLTPATAVGVGSSTTIAGEHSKLLCIM